MTNRILPPGAYPKHILQVCLYIMLFVCGASSFTEAAPQTDSARQARAASTRGGTPSRKIPFDFDGDGKSDLAVFRPATGTWWIAKSSTSFDTGANYIAYRWGTNGDVPVAGDYDGDGKCDMAVFRPNNSTWYASLSSTNNATYLIRPWGTNGDVPVPGDYDGDGKTDTAIFRPSDGYWWIFLSESNTYINRQWGNSTDTPVVEDFDGDGKSDLAVFRPATGTWWIAKSSTNFDTGANYISYQWGTNGDVPVAGDYDGDGQADYAVFRPSTSIWHVSHSSNNSSTGQAWGILGDVPAHGDYDGDGKTDLAVFRPGAGTWHILFSFDFSYLTRQWGNSTDTIVPAPGLRPNPYTGPASAADTARFLEQATFGPTPSEITRVQGVGFRAYLNDQFLYEMSSYPTLPLKPTDPFAGCPNGSPPTCLRDNYTMYPLQLRFYWNAIYGQDQLRQRVAFALHQIFVVSGRDIQQPSWMSPYLQILDRNALGSYRQLLYEITLNPAMGTYLDTVVNSKNNPNENYAREVLQLFSIGLNRLNEDGTLMLDAQGNPIPTYDQSVVTGFTKVFTGWRLAAQPGPGILNGIDSMVATESLHDTTAKQLLDGVTLPAGQTAAQDLDAALDNIFHHPNTGPFISTQLIQHLVTSNPSPGYVGRVAAVFNNNGAGVRGDLGAVVKAILFDPEARGDVKTDPAYGHLREPALYITNILRAFNARSANGSTTSDGYLNPQSLSMDQDIFRAPSVFNYYPPDYSVPGANGLLGPEFGILSTSTTLKRVNFVNTMVFSRINTSTDAPNGTSIDLSPMQALAGDPQQLVEALNQLLMHGAMSSGMRNQIVQAVSSVSSTNTLLRAQTAVYLVLTSTQYQVER
jgi:hypothetical protein